MKQMDDRRWEAGWLLSSMAPWQEHAEAVLVWPPPWEMWHLQPGRVPGAVPGSSQAPQGKGWAHGCQWEIGHKQEKGI